MISDAIRLDPEYASLIKTLKDIKSSKRRLPLYVSGISGGADISLMASALKDISSPCVILAPNEKEAHRISRGLCGCGIFSVMFLYREPVLYNYAASHASEYERLSALLSILTGDAEAVVTTPAAFMGYTVPPHILSRASFELSVGDELPPSELALRLVSSGYIRRDMVEAPGQFAARGGIIDIFPAFVKEGENLYPYRLEFFGDDLDRICTFDIDTQRARENERSVFIPPACELLISEEARKNIEKAVKETRKKTVEPDAAKALDGEIAAIELGGELPFADKYLPLVYPERVTLSDYLSPDTVCFVCGSNAVKNGFETAEWHNAEGIKDLLENGTAIAKYVGVAKERGECESFLSALPTVHINVFTTGQGHSLAGLFNICTRAGSKMVSRELLLEDIGDFISSGMRIAVGVGSEAEMNALSGILRDSDIATALIASGDIDISSMAAGVVYISVAPYIDGFELTAGRFVYLALSEDTGRKKGSVRKASRKKREDTKKILSYAELAVGDLVVHEKFGIGRYLGIEQLKIDGVTRDFINIQYDGSDKLFIPTTQLDLVSKYIGAHSDDGLLKLSKMGGAEWKRSTSRAKGAVKDMAKELIKLYAERLRRPGYAFPEDDAFQGEFDSSFEYEETESQLMAIEDIKEDMQKPCPMDRLLCGDVGYGKTEVALRAAFKAVLAGKQVALLCPTTILAFQHFRTALSRMRGFPVTVEMLTRFRSPKEQKVILRRLARGEIDIIIGTHKLVYGTVEFKDLGLLIIDEEQRFGVAQKEKLKQLTAGVDVLSLSATPIPRTLNMAIGGIRDLSVLDEPPVDRQPVQTYVLEYDPLIINDAIRRELARGGQVFYLFNRVDMINSVAARIAKDIDGARVAVAHGQMEKEEIEDVWQSLLAGDIDILVSTSIIETGVDVPNANTLIIEDADRMGLSQLHQLRGRVGRSGRRAYAYFTFRKGKVLTEIAEKRLEAIREYAQFGAGFRVALRDLEIRGAGDMLGAQQHGHLDAVGYDLYMKLLNQAVLEEKGIKIEERKECTIDIKVDAFIPESYIPSQSQRIEQYKHISLIRGEDDALDVAEELSDRYGDFPRSVDNLLRIAKLRASAEAIGLTRIDERERNIIFRSDDLDFAIWSELFSRLPQFKLRAQPGAVASIFAAVPQGKSMLAAAEYILSHYKKVLKEEEAAMAENVSENKDAKA